jgi:glycosyltransferase involved in cell wall biosynthesis
VNNPSSPEALQKPELVVFGENKIGGVQNLYYGLLSNDINNQFDKLWIFTDDIKSSSTRLLQPYNVCREIFFEFSDLRRPTARRLSKLVSNRPGVVVVNNMVELMAMHLHRKSNKAIIYVCHDEYYLKAARSHEFLIDAYIAHNPHFFERLRELLPPERRKDVYYLPFGIKTHEIRNSPRLSGELRIIFIGRLVNPKGIFDLPKVDDHLKSKGVSVQWTIVGAGPDKERLMKEVEAKSNFTFITPGDTEGVLKVAASQDVYVLPSYLDGLPVALLEAMSVGLVPVVYEFNAGIRSVVTEDIGFVVKSGAIDEMASRIIYLDQNRELMAKMGDLARRMVREKYEVTSRAKAYYDLFSNFSLLKRERRNVHFKYDGSLDLPLVPQFVRDAGRWLKRALGR